MEATNTFVSYNGCSQSLIEFICIWGGNVDLVDECTIVDDDCLNVSNHRPILAKLALPVEVSDICRHIDDMVCWRKVTNSDMMEYQYLLSCDDDLQFMTHGKLCYQEISTAYRTLTEKIHKYANQVFPKRSYKSHLKPYWNNDLTNAHKHMKFLRNAWCGAGRPRNKCHEAYHNYKQAKCDFRRLHRRIVMNYLHQKDLELDQAAELDANRFWKTVKSRRQNKFGQNGTALNFDGEIV
ncbi:hypothetical protein ACF0H5_020732 [Mactra antiquata]